MPKARGRLSIEDLRKRVEDSTVDSVVAGFTDHYGRLMGKRFDAEYFLESVASEGAHACNYLLTTDIEMQPVRGYQFANWERGYGDFHLRPDLQTLRQGTWLERTAIVHCDVDGVEVAPRSILKRQIAAVNAAGFSPFAASELEYYLFRTSYREAAQKRYESLEPIGWYLEDYNLLQGTREEFFTAAARRHLKESGIAVESSKGEWGLGQHEINLLYTGVLAMADNHVLYKQCLKEVAEQNGVSLTFMAKYSHEQAGSGCHLH